MRRGLFLEEILCGAILVIIYYIYKRPQSLRLTRGSTLRKPLQSGLGCLLGAVGLTTNSKNPLTDYKETTQTENLKDN